MDSSSESRRSDSFAQDYHMAIHLVSIDRDGVVRLASQGDIDMQDVQSAQDNPFKSLLGEKWATYRVLLDLSASRTITSAGIGWLIASQKHYKNSGGQFVVHSVQANVKQVLDLLKVHKAVPIALDETAARQLITESPNG
jgi:anti-anti-sigma factor